MASSENFDDIFEMMIDEQDRALEELPDTQTIVKLYKEEQKRLKAQSKKRRKNQKNVKVDKNLKLLFISDDNRYIDSTH